MLYLSGPVWTFEGSPKGYFVRNVSAEVRDIAATGGVRWMGVGVGVGGASFGKLYFQNLVVPFLLRQLRENAFPERPRQLPL